jgi:hypothetical protein
VPNPDHFFCIHAMAFDDDGAAAEMFLCMYAHARNATPETLTIAATIRLPR